MPNFITLALLVWSESMVRYHQKWPKFKFHENWPKNDLGQKIFLDQLQLLDCEQCAKNEHPIIKNGPTIPLSS